MGPLTDLVQKSCRPCKKGTAAFSKSRIAERLKCVPAWRFGKGAITRQFRFKDYKATMAFVNAVARLAEREDHHPEIRFGYRSAQVSYSTHAVHGISENDFISAAKADRIYGRT